MKIKIALIDPCPAERSSLRVTLHQLLTNSHSVDIVELSGTEEIEEKAAIDLVLLKWTAPQQGKEERKNTPESCPDSDSFPENTDSVRSCSNNNQALLTVRERQILSFLKQGKRLKEIAAIMHLKYSTISSYKYRIYEKLEVDNIVDLMKRTQHYPE